MEGMCDDDDCSDDAEWRVVYVGKDGKEVETILCSADLKKLVEMLKKEGLKPISLEKYVDPDDEDEDEDEDEGEEE